MTNIHISEDCGNSPKNIFVQELIIAFARRDVEYLLDRVTEDIQWDIVGDRWVVGKVEFDKTLREMGNDEVLELTVLHVATHGKVGAVNGVQRLKKGKMLAFCDVYEFGNTKGSMVKAIRSYLIEIE